MLPEKSTANILCISLDQGTPLRLMLLLLLPLLRLGHRSPSLLLQHTLRHVPF